MPTDRARREAYLEALRKADPGTHPADVLRGVGGRPFELVKWRTLSGFKKQEEQLLGEFRERQLLPIPPPFIAFLDYLSSSDDRIEACKQAGLKWRHVVEELERNKVFRDELDALMTERNLRLEDALYRKGKTGDTTSGKAYLAVNDPRYGKADAPPPAPPPADDEEARVDELMRRISAAAKAREKPAEESPLAGAIPMAGAN